MNEEERFRQMYGDTARMVYGFLRRRCDHDTAEAVLSDVYLKAWQNLATLDEGNPTGWLIATARTSLVDHHRSQNRNERLVNDFASLVRHDDVITIEGAVIERMTVIGALASLDETDREALLMVGWDGLDHATAARALGISSAAFAQRVSRARKRLAARLDPSPTQSAVVRLPVELTRPAQHPTQLKEA